ncbi:MAG: glycosyltransferase [bacterium]|nr:glycosyltransferase [bacterium]
MEPLVSVIIPTFNRRAMVAEAVASVQAQTMGAWECLVVDDGSTDGTAEAIEAVADERVHLLRQENRGVAAARNRGIATSRAPLVAFLDSDDLWHPAKLARQVAVMDEGWALCHTDEVWVRRGERVNPKNKHAKSGGWLLERSLELCCISPSAAMVRRDVIEALGGFDESYPVCEDYDLWLRLTARYQVAFVPEPLVTKRGGHADQLSASRWGLDRWRVAAIEKLLDEGRLDAEARRSAVAELHRKCDILVGGFAKRGKEAEAAHYRLIKERYPLHQSTEAVCPGSRS